MVRYVCLGGNFEGCAAEKRQRRKKQGTKGGRGREGGVEGEREESTPKSVSVASYREVVPYSWQRFDKHFQSEIIIKHCHSTFCRSVPRRAATTVEIQNQA